ncbi:MAG TPA: hypothetical protein VHB45_15190 [Alloacidobacterium sp.]|nr:hypothetical protein [Alloacidobacterium sp.]
MQSQTVLRFVLAVLATWRITHLLANEDGPADIIVRFRRLLGNSLAGSLMDCFYCLSLWIAAAAAFFVSTRLLEWFFVWLALSGAACLLQCLERTHEAIPPTSQPLKGDLNHVLRIETLGTEKQSFIGDHAPESSDDSPTQN